jgi:alpha-L-fucosidase
VKKNERLTDAEYQKYFDLFNPDLYDPRAWARTGAASRPIASKPGCSGNTT